MKKYTDAKVDSLDKLKAANRKLRADTLKLRKEVARLRKELDKSRGMITEPFEEEEDEFLEPEKINITEDASEVKYKCGKCKQIEVVPILAGIYKFFLCKSCGYRFKKNSKSADML